MNEQTATSPDDSPESQVQESESEPGIEDILAEFEEETSKKPEPEPEPQKAEKPDTAEITQLKQRLDALDQERAEQENLNAVKSLKVDGLDQFDPQDVLDWMKVQASRDPRIERAYGERHNKPDEWSKVLESMGKTFASKFHRGDAQTVQDREAVNAAVRGQSNEPGPVHKYTNEELSKMPLHELMRVAQGKA